MTFPDKHGSPEDVLMTAVGDVNMSGKAHHMERELSEDDEPTVEATVPKWKRPPLTGPEEMLYKVNERPPLPTAFALALQHFLTMAGGTISCTLLVLNLFCMEHELVAQVEVLGTVFFAMGMATLLQTTFGVRLPIVQGPTASLWLPTIATMALPQYKECPALLNGTYNYSSPALAAMYGDEAPWRFRLQIISGMVMCAGAFQMFLGISGLVSVLLRFVGPLVIMPTITLIALPLYRIAALQSEGHWPIAWMTFGLIVSFIFYLSPYNVPFPWYSRRKGFHLIWCGVFGICPVILGLVLSWIICFILTVSNVFPNDPTAWGYRARTDTRVEVLRNAPWFMPPYPGQFGLPRAIASPLLGFFAGVICSVIESVGDYSVTAKVSHAPTPPDHAISRGIFMEGFAGLLAGLIGSPVGTTSYSENTAAIGITKVASRRVIQFTGCILLLLGCFKKFSAFFVGLPSPIMGGVYITLFSMLAGIGLGPLQYVVLGSSRNMFIAGVSLFCGFLIPDWLERQPEQTWNLGHPIVTETVNILLRIPMFVGGMVAILLDNTIPGTMEERGMKKWRPESSKNLRPETLRHYDLRVVLWLCERWPKLGWLPILPPLHRIKRQLITHNNDLPETPAS